MRAPRRSFLVPLLALLALLVAAGGAAAGKASKAKKKYHFELATVKAQASADDKLAADAVRLLEAEVQEQFAKHPQMVADLTGAPDPDANPKAYAKWLARKKIQGSYLVSVDLTMYREELEDAPTGNGNKRLVVRLELHMFGETIPDRKMAFEGVGSATVKQDVGKKVRPRDREFTIESAIEVAVADAMAESLRKLALPPAKPKK